MPDSVDNRVVSMKFDNQSFEQRIATTLASLAKLKGGMAFEGSTKSLNELSAAGRSFNLDGIGKAVDNISSHFSALSVVAFTVISQITAKALQAGAQMAKSLTIEPLIDGLHEYETNMNSIQTILANTKADHTSLDQVNAALDKLNTFSDQTIYNFSQMAKNIGTFTAAGVDLDTSVNAIKGIANLAAISGSNADQASTAMYQLSQALASGSVKLMDWNSVVNAGMGGEVFQKALFETGKSLKTIKDVPMGETFDEWKKKGNTFRDSLQDGWITADVLTNTLSAFTGDLNEAQLVSLGYTKKQAVEFAELGRTGKLAATEVKTVTQLLGTIKEAIGSGWSTSFRLVIGNFEEAKTLLTGINNTVGGFIKKFSDARNNLLTGWRWLGGREALLTGLSTAFKSLGSVLTSIAKAFRDVFPAATATSLFAMTNRFKEFMISIKPSPIILIKIHDIFTGLFAAISIGINIIKAIAKTFQVFFRTLGQVSGGPILDFFQQFSFKIQNLKRLLVDGGGIQDFMFKYLLPLARTLGSLNFAGAISWLIDKLSALKDAIVNFFSDGGAGATGANKMADAADRLGDRWGWLISIGEKLADLGRWVGDKLSSAAGKIGAAFGTIIDKIAETFSGADTDKILDALNTGLFAALILTIRKFIKSGFKFDIGDGLLTNISKSFKELTGTLSAMQANLKAEALMKIAIAIGILTASVLILSMIDSAKLTAAMTAMAVGFGQLITAMSLINKAVTGPMDAAKLVLVSGGLILLAGAILVLSVAMKILSTMDTAEIAKGLTAIGGLLTELTIAMNAFPDSGQMIRTGIGMIAVAVAITILSASMKILGSMDPAEIAKGLTAIGGLLTELTISMRSMPKDMLGTGIGIIGIAIGIGILSGAMKIIATMSVEDIAKGLGAMAIMLTEVSIAVNSMPTNMPIIGLGLILVGIGIAAITASIFAIGQMDLNTLIQGLAGVAAVLVILAVATNAMTGSLLGAVAIGVVAGALVVLAAAVGAFANIGLLNLAIGLGGLTAALVVLGVVSIALTEAIPVMLGLGIALTAIAAGIALFGIAALAVGAAIYLVASALKILSEIGITAVKSTIEALKLLAQALPEIVKYIVQAVLAFAQGMIDGLPPLITGLGAIIEALLNLVISEAPKFAEAAIVMISSMITAIRTLFPQLTTAGFELLMTFLNGLSSNIEQITNVVIDIVTKFLNTLADRAGELTQAGLRVLIAVLNGIASNIGMVVDAGFNIVQQIVISIGNNLMSLINMGTRIIVSIVQGLSNNINKVVTAGANLIISFIQGVASNSLRVINAAADTVISFVNGLATAIRTKGPELRAAGWNLASALVDGMTGGIGDLVHKVVDKAVDMARQVKDAVFNFFGVNSPSKMMIELGGYLGDGLAKGLDENTSASRSAVMFGKDVSRNLNNAIAIVAASIDGIDEFKPTITPVLDLSNVQRGAQKLSGLLSVSQIDASVSFDQASSVAASARDNFNAALDVNAQPVVQEVKFEQTINAPRELSTADIYRGTKSQIALAKEELKK